MSLLKRLEHGGASFASPPPTHTPEVAPVQTRHAEPTPLRPAAPVNQAAEAQRSLKDRVKRKLISELDPSIDCCSIKSSKRRTWSSPARRKSACSRSLLPT